MAVFTIRKSAAVLTPDTGTVTFLVAIAATNRALRVQEVSMSGLGTASAANEIQVAPSPTGTTPGGAITPSPYNPLSTAAAAFTTATSWATSPVVVAATGIGFGVNGNGGTYRWLAKTNFELIAMQAVASMAVMSYKVVSGTSTVAFHTIIEEL